MARQKDSLYTAYLKMVRFREKIKIPFVHHNLYSF